MVGERVADRRDHYPTLTDLAPEVLDGILLRALPDPTDLQWAFGPHVAVDLLTAPILRTSRYLRRKCLSLIRDTYLWIHVTFHDRDVIEEFSDYNPYIPAIPTRLHPLVVQGSASVRLHFKPEFPHGADHGSNDAIILPFNFATLIHICNVVNELSADIFGEILTIQCHNVRGHFRETVQHLVAPVLTTLYRLSRFHAEGDYGKELFEPVTDNTRPGVSMWDLEAVTRRASLVLRQAGELQTKGYIEESEMLFLHHSSFKYLAAHLLPPPGEWIFGHYDPATADDGVSSPFTGQCPRGNQLRRLLRQVDHRACLAYVNFATRYGWRWVEAYRHSIGVGPEGFLAEPRYTWFGASITELGDLHYERALIRELAWKYRNKRDHRQPDKLYSEDAMLDMYFASTLQPNNEKYQRFYEAYKEQMGKKTKSVERKAERRLTIKMTGPESPGGPWGAESWVGDSQMLEAWGGEEMLGYNPLVQEGLDNSPNMKEWSIDWLRLSRLRGE